jgi:2-dehydro-3-deoxyphosphogluconate aldolase/(4S)-4-hydroxy-2-oxoglutarate aldolase
MLDIVELLQRERIVAVMRKIDHGSFLSIVESLLAGGVRVLEVTMDGTDAEQQIVDLKQRFAGEVVIGAGTVLTVSQLEQATDAGAEFVVCPHLDPNLIEAAHNRGCPIVPGTFSPTEIQLAMQLGAQAVKVFPARTLGSNYIHDVLGPFGELKIMATGGVDEANVADFFRAGVTAVGMGNALFPKDEIHRQDWRAITERARRIQAKIG